MRFTVPAPAQLGDTLRGLRKARKRTQVEIGTASGLNQKTVSNLETAPHRCSVESLFRYLAAVGATVILEQSESRSMASRSPDW